MQFMQITIAKAIRHIEQGEYVIPVIQRDFVWQPQQVERLFDSLMRDYPIGTFLFWEVPTSTLQEYPFFAFAKDIVRNTAHPERIEAAPKNTVTAVLDGQQRLTSFLLATRGSYTSRGRGRAGLQRRELFVDLMAYREEAGEEKTSYSFRFMTPEERRAEDNATTHWYRVGDAASVALGPQVLKYIQQQGLADHEHALDTLYKLCEKLQKDEVVNYYLEETDDIGRVLNIFVRLNRGGTTLSYPDLLLGAATTGWKQLDARREFAALQYAVNSYGFSFKKDRILKTAMVLSNLEDIKFKAESFKAHNAIEIEAHWPKVRSALPVAAALLRSFGLDETTLTAENAIIPVAYYALHRGLKANYISLHGTSNDRERIKRFVLRSLLKGSFWTGAVDPILLACRKAIQQHGAKQFPLAEIEDGIRRSTKKTLRFTDAEVEELLNTRYGRRTTALVLSLLYPGARLTDVYHQDHVIPRTLLRESRLRTVGVTSEEISLIMDRRDTVPNLQLLPGPQNMEKSKKSLNQYLQGIKPVAKRRHYIDFHDLVVIPNDASDFLKFYDARRTVMRDRLRRELG